MTVSPLFSTSWAKGVLNFLIFPSSSDVASDGLVRPTVTNVQVVSDLGADGRYLTVEAIDVEVPVWLGDSDGAVRLADGGAAVLDLARTPSLQTAYWERTGRFDIRVMAVVRRESRVSLIPRFPVLI